MYTVAGIADLHERTHRSLRGLIDHCAGFDAAVLSREREGFAYPTILLQLHHAIGAERYWVGVLQGLMLVEENEANHASIEAIRAFHERVTAATHAYLGSIGDEAVNTVRPMTTWGDKVVDLLPAHVVLRTQTHIFQHQGQIAAMSRLLGRPIPAGLDFAMR